LTFWDWAVGATSSFFKRDLIEFTDVLPGVVFAHPDAAARCWLRHIHITVEQCAGNLQTVAAAGVSLTVSYMPWVVFACFHATSMAALVGERNLQNKQGSNAQHRTNSKLCLPPLTVPFLLQIVVFDFSFALSHKTCVPIPPVSKLVHTK
jgi:hypothetical protein